MGSVHFPLLNDMEFQERVQLLRQDFTREYHEQVAALELAFRQRLYQSYLHAISQQEAMGSVLFPPLSEMEMGELVRQEILKTEQLRQDFSQKYNEQVAELELAFMQRRYQSQLHAISQHEVQHEAIHSQRMQQRRSRPLDLRSPEQQQRDIAGNLHKWKKQRKESGVLSKKLQKDSSKSVDSKLPEGPGWCSVCEVDCNTEKGFEQHILSKDHQSMVEKLGQGLAGDREKNSKQKKSVTEKELKERYIIDNLHKQAKQIMKEGIPSKDKKKDCSRWSERPGWCALCQVQCKSENDLKKHILGKKHQSKFKMLKQDSGGKANSKQPKYLTEQQQQERDIICNLDKRVNQIKEIGIPSKNLQDCSRSLDSGLPERPGWCALCEVQCTSENNLKRHILGKKHQSKVASEPHPLTSMDMEVTLPTRGPGILPTPKVQPHPLMSIALPAPNVTSQPHSGLGIVPTPDPPYS